MNNVQQLATLILSGDISIIIMSHHSDEYIDSFLACWADKIKIYGVCSDYKSDYITPTLPFKLLTAEDIYKIPDNETHRYVAVNSNETPWTALDLELIVRKKHLRSVSLYELLQYLPVSDMRYSNWHSYISNHQESILHIKEVLVDENSRLTLDAYNQYFLTGNTTLRRSIERPYDDIYFYNRYFNYQPSEVLFDIGASWGESLEKFLIHPSISINQFKHVSCFEPCPNQYESLLNRQKKLHRAIPTSASIKCYNMAVGDFSGKAAFNFDGFGSSMLTDGSSMVQITTVDKHVEEYLYIPTLIKVDVEGSELAVVAGAYETILNHKPKIAISAYHHPSHLIELYKELSSIRPDYKFALEHYNHKRFDTVLLAF